MKYRRVLQTTSLTEEQVDELNSTYLDDNTVGFIRHGGIYSDNLAWLLGNKPEKVLYLSPEPHEEFSDFETILTTALESQGYDIIPDSEVEGWLQATKSNNHLEYVVFPEKHVTHYEGASLAFCIKAKILLPQITTEEYPSLIELLAPFGVDYEYHHLML